MVVLEYYDFAQSVSQVWRFAPRAWHAMPLQDVHLILVKMVRMPLVCVVSSYAPIPFKLATGQFGREMAFVRL